MPPSFPAKQHTRHCSSSPNRKARLFDLKESKQFDGGIRIGHGTGERVVVSEHLEVLAVAPGAAVGGHQPVEGPVPASEPGQPDPHGHPRSLLVLRLFGAVDAVASGGRRFWERDGNVLSLSLFIEMEWRKRKRGGGVAELDEGTTSMGRSIAWAFIFFQQLNGLSRAQHIVNILFSSQKS